MESLKSQKGSAKSSVPVAIRFNAGEESVEDVTKPSESLSSSPVHGNSDDSSWRKDFLQGGFFSRKRSGSIEGTSSLISNLSNDSNTVGTWKLIKGKVSQAMEDIKSSKHDSPVNSNNKSVSDHESDADSTTINSSISDDFNEAAAITQHSPMGSSYKSASNKIVNTDSDSDIDSDLLLMCQENESSILNKSFNNLRSKKPSTKDKLMSKINKTKDGWTGSATLTHQNRPFLRRRKKDEAISASTTKDKQDNVEIESGIEITEEMTLNPNLTDDQPNLNDPENRFLTSLNLNSIQYDRIDSTAPQTLPTKSISASVAFNRNEQQTEKTTTTANLMIRSSFSINIFRLIYERRSIIFIVSTFLLCWLCAVPQFFQGVFACLGAISLAGILQKYLLNYIKSSMGSTINSNGPERIPFAIPDYHTMPICEIPAAEEHKQLKSYSGWMNEINNYDPANYHSSMTRSVFVKLDGSIIRLSSTNARIPKRAMWNETLIDRKHITFHKHRCYDLLGCRIEMCPRGLARKRHFSRKYPIHLLIKNKSSPLKIDFVFDNDEISNKTINTTNDPLGTTNATVISVPANEFVEEKLGDLDFASTILLSDLQKLQEHQDITSKDSIPCGDDIRILLFARSDREKEDWFRRFMAASLGAIDDQQLQFSDMVMVNEDDVVAALKAAAMVNAGANLEKDSPETSEEKSSTATTDTIQPIQQQSVDNDGVVAGSGNNEYGKSRSNSLFEGLLMTSCAARGPAEYIKFMSRYQNACSQKSIPVIPVYPGETHSRKNRREKKQEDELWKGIDQSLYLGPSGSVVWANVLVGRILFSCLNDDQLLGNIQEFLQKKLSAIKLPSFMEEVIIAQVNLGDTPPLVHRVSQPLLDERGTWIDADITYEGLMHMTITTKLNLLRLKKQQQHADPNLLAHTDGGDRTGEAIYDSNAESSGASSSESESPIQTNVENLAEQQSFYAAQGGSKKFLRIVDRITASNFFQSATEIPYIQKAMENMSTKIRLRVELKGLVARCTINIPAPPSDRIWIGFRGPPRLWISATPAVGDHTFDWSIVTNAIESKLCDEVAKYLVYPNMVDMIAPFLGQSTYKE